MRRVGEASAGLPAPKVPGRYRIGFVCTGNICRSPTADVVLAALVASDGGHFAGLTIDSCGIGDWHLGNPMDSRAARVLRAAGFRPDDHRAQQLSREWYASHDLLLGMDAGHVRDLRRLAPVGVDERRIRLFGEFDPAAPGGDVPDPYYGGDEGFEEVLSMVERTCRALLPELRTVLESP